VSVPNGFYLTLKQLANLSKGDWKRVDLFLGEPFEGDKRVFNESTPTEVVDWVHSKMEDGGETWCKGHSCWEPTPHACYKQFTAPEYNVELPKSNPQVERAIQELMSRQGYAQSSPGMQRALKNYKEKGELPAGFDSAKALEEVQRMKRIKHLEELQKRNAHSAAQRSKGLEELLQEKGTWQLTHLNRCPDCQIDTVRYTQEPPPQPKDVADRLIYSEKPCGCTKLAELLASGV